MTHTKTNELHKRLTQFHPTNLEIHRKPTCEKTLSLEPVAEKEESPARKERRFALLNQCEKDANKRTQDRRT